MRSHPKGAIFHTANMFGGYEESPVHKPLYLAAKNEEGRVVAMLCSVQVSLSQRMSRWTSRSLMYAEPVCDDTPEGINGLSALLEVHDKQVSKDTLFSEIRPISDAGPERQALQRSGYQHCDYFNYVQDLEEGMEGLGKRAKKVKRKVDAALRRGAEVRRVPANAEAVDRAYHLIACSYQRAKVPLAPIEMFQAMQSHLPDGALQIRELWWQGRMVAAAIGLIFKNRFFAWYNGTVRPQGLASTAVLVWDELTQACDLGLRYYDFGGAGWPDESYGPRTFKSRFKGNLVNYGRYRKINSKLKMNVAKYGYQLLRGAISGRPAQSISSVLQDQTSQ